MWWKILAVVLIVYTITAGLLVPLKPGVTFVSPASASTGKVATFQVHGYNSCYTKAPASDIRVWLEFDSLNALAAQHLTVLNDTTLEVQFTFPTQTPKGSQQVMLNAIVDHPTDGVSLLPSAIELVQGADTATAGNKEMWDQHPVNKLHVFKNFSFPYRNIIYESVRNLYFHVPMWFALMFMFIASVVYSVLYLGNPKTDYDRYAAAFAETGLLFGVMGLVTGMLWAHYAWGAAWSNDIKQLMTAVALLIYLAYFILRSSFDEAEKGARLAAVYNIFAFASLVPLLYIVPRMFASLHPGATGNPAFGKEDLDNTMRAVFYPAIIGWSLLGLWITTLRVRYQRLEDKSLGLD
jgi:heme exporter protein C